MNYNKTMIEHVENLISQTDCKKLRLYHINSSNNCIFNWWCYDLKAICHLNLYAFPLPAIEIKDGKLTIYTFYKCSKQHAIAEALIRYLSADHIWANDTYWYFTYTSIDPIKDALMTVENIELTIEKENINKEFLLDTIEKNLEWIDGLNLKNRVQITLENRQIDSMIKSIDKM